ncbi:MAG: class II glutamine amidotransferase [Deltaproteobacteria bacterium HGW-Deltaproteobacteria-20]|jgi:glutamine amidotransferase|nr:MAG: class II glutamine amidotransferase [Deltaproteobacteria bacterium HGW-Deltaproteobacteria-20]
MERLFGFIGNRSDLGSRVLDVDAAALATPAAGSRLGWGVGFYQAGEVLLRRRPMDDRQVIDVASLTRDVRTDALLGSVRAPSFGEPRTQNTQPFRYRDWLFVHQGKVNAFERLRDRLVESIPDFLRGNVRGETDSELVFFLFLSFLHDAGKLRGPTVPTVVTEAMRGSCALLDRLSREEGAEDAGEMALLVCNGEYIAGLTRDADMAFRPVRGENDIDALLSQDALRGRRLPDMARVRFTVVASGQSETRPGWTKMPAHSTVIIDRLDEPVVETF